MQPKAASDRPSNNMRSATTMSYLCVTRFQHFCLDCAVFLIEKVWSSSVSLKQASYFSSVHTCPAICLISFPFLDFYAVYRHFTPLNMYCSFLCRNTSTDITLHQIAHSQIYPTKYHKHLNPLITFKAVCNPYFCLNLRWELLLFCGKLKPGILNSTHREIGANNFLPIQ